MTPAAWVPFVRYWRQTCWPLRGSLFPALSRSTGTGFRWHSFESVSALFPARCRCSSTCERLTHTRRDAVPPMTVSTHGCSLWSALLTASSKHCVISQNVHQQPVECIPYSTKKPFHFDSTKTLKWPADSSSFALFKGSCPVKMARLFTLFMETSMARTNHLYL